MIQLKAAYAAALQEAASAVASDFNGQESFRQRYPNLKRRTFQKIASQLTVQMKACGLDQRAGIWRLTNTEAERIIEVKLADELIVASNLLLKFLTDGGVYSDSERLWQGARQMLISQRTAAEAA